MDNSDGMSDNTDGMKSKTASKVDIIAMYGRYKCPAEVIVPFRLPEKNISLFTAARKTRYMGPLWNMDSPWITTMVMAGVATIFGAVLVFLSDNVLRLGASHGLAASLSVVSAFPLVFALCSPLLYPLLVGTNLRFAYGKDWPQALLGPTHIGITDSGFKLHVRGRLFYNYPNLAIWPEIFDCDLIGDELYNTISLRFVYQTGFGRMPITLPLIGFCDVDDLRLVLEHFARYIPIEHQSEAFKRMAEDGFAVVLEAFSKGELALLQERED